MLDTRMLIMHIKRRHILLLAGISAIIVGVFLMSITVSRIYWDFPPSGFYIYSTHPFYSSGLALCALGAVLVSMYVLFKVWALYKTRKDTELKLQAEAARIEEEQKAKQAAIDAMQEQQAIEEVDGGAEPLDEQSSVGPEQPEWQPPPLNEATETQQ